SLPLSVFTMLPPPPSPPLFPYTTLFRSISTWPDFPPWVTSFSSSGEVETRTSAPERSFVSHEITTLPCPKKTGFGLAQKCAFRRSEEHTSELQSPYDLVCRLLLEKKKKK